MSSPSKKRIFADIRELRANVSSNYTAEPLEDNIFEWHFTIRGPQQTNFEGGVYHGRIILPSEYPFKPPSIIFLTPNGRFQVGKKICLSISAHHPEHWQPAWGVRLILEALISFLPTEANGALGALDWSAEERTKLAMQSQEWCCPRCGRIHDLLPEASEDMEPSGGSEFAADIAQLHVHGLSSPRGTPERRPREDSAVVTAGGADDEQDSSERPDGVTPPDTSGAADREPQDGLYESKVAEAPVRARQDSDARARVPEDTAHRGEGQDGPAAPPTPDIEDRHPVRLSDRSVSRGAIETQPDTLWYVAAALVVLIVGLVFRKLVRASGLDFAES